MFFFGTCLLYVSPLNIIYVKLDLLQLVSRPTFLVVIQLVSFLLNDVTVHQALLETKIAK